MTPDGPERPLPPWLPVLAVAAACAAVAGGLRVWTLAEMESANPLYIKPILDERFYLELARGEHGERPWFVAPLYPALLSLLGVISRHGAAMTNVLLGSLTAGLAAVGGAHQGRSLVGGVVAGGLVAVSGALVFGDTTVGTESVVMFLTLLGVLGLARAASVPGPMPLALAGAALGLASLGRANALAALLGAIPALRMRRARGEGFRGAAALLGGTAVVLLAGAAWNAASNGPFRPFPWAGGMNLWLANNPWARERVVYGTDLFPNNPQDQEIGARRVAEEDEGRALDTSELSSYWTARTLASVTDEPVPAAAYLGRKALLVFTADEIGGNHDAVAEREFAPWTSIAPVGVWWILALGCGGWWIARRRTAAADALALAAAGHLATLALLFPLARYRVPIVPVFAVLAGAGAAALAARDVSRKTVVSAGAAVLVVSALAFLPLRDALHFEGYTNLGLAAYDTEVDSLPWFERALADHADADVANLWVGNFALQDGDAEGALEHFRRAAKSAFTRRDALVFGGYALSNLGRHDDALAMNDTLVAERPQDAGAIAEGALLAWVAGRKDEARRRLAAAKAVDPSVPKVHEIERRMR